MGPALSGKSQFFLHCRSSPCSGCSQCSVSSVTKLCVSHAGGRVVQSRYLQYESKTQKVTEMSVDTLSHCTEGSHRSWAIGTC